MQVICRRKYRFSLIFSIRCTQTLSFLLYPTVAWGVYFNFHTNPWDPIRDLFYIYNYCLHEITFYKFLYFSKFFIRPIMLPLKIKHTHLLQMDLLCFWTFFYSHHAIFQLRIFLTSLHLWSNPSHYLSCWVWWME